MAMSSDTAAINGMIYSYKALSTGAQIVGQRTLWTETRIQSVVNGEYVSGRLKAGDRQQLGQTLAFGDGLTDDTYLDFILERARKLFLALCEVGRQERIFHAIDLSYDDGDLPLPQEAVAELGLAAKGDDKINRRFQSIQHQYVLRELQEGDHQSYRPEETVPVEYVHKAAAASSLQQWIRVRVPSQPGELFARRQLLTTAPDAADDVSAEFLEDVETARLVPHDHIMPIWASYTHKGAAYIITPFVAEYSLNAYLEAKYTPQFGQLSKYERPRLLLKWIHCLSDTLSHLHNNGFPHSAIMPSNIVIDSGNNVAFSDVACLTSFQHDKSADYTEVYDYSAPEAHQVNRSPHIIAPPTRSIKSSIGSRLFRRKRSQTVGSSDNSSSEGLEGGWLAGDYTNGSSPKNFSRPLGDEKHVRVTESEQLPQRQQIDGYGVSPKAPSIQPSEKADVFALGCIFVNILSYMHKFRMSDVTKHIRSPQASRSQKFLKSAFDTSFQGNLPRVHAWLDHLQDTAFESDDWCFRAVPHLVSMIRAMLCPDPAMRPSAPTVREHIRGILTQYAKIRDEDLHCGHTFDHWDKCTSCSTNPSSKAPSVKSSPGLRNSVYTSSSRCASTYYSGTSAFAGIGAGHATSPTITEDPYQWDSTLPKLAERMPSGLLRKQPSNLGLVNA